MGKSRFEENPAKIDATRPPGTLGLRELAGEMMFLGAERTYSYFQSELVMRGRLLWNRASEEVIAEALRLTAEHLPDVEDDARRMLAYRAWEVEALALRSDPRAAAAHLRRHVEPLVAVLPAAAQTRITGLVQDLLGVLEGRSAVRSSGADGNA